MLPQIEAFLEVARRQNLSRAAEALFVSQPTLTARLQSLEASLGEQLFVRTRRGMRLTEAGEAFLPYAEHAVAALADGRERLDELRRGVAGRLVLGAPPTVSTYTLPALLARFSAAHPNVRLAVKTGTSEEVLEMVLHDQVQLGIIRSLVHQEIESVPLYTDALVLIAGPGHRLASAAHRPARSAWPTWPARCWSCSGAAPATWSSPPPPSARPACCPTASWSWTTSRRPRRWSSAASACPWSRPAPSPPSWPPAP